jgi:ubiquinone/menaquinone biosynthesis C-methylase UbiE/ribosomal protein L44E
MSVSLQEQTQAHYDHYPFIEGGEKRVQWWRKYLRDFLPDEDIRGRLMLDVGSSIGEISRGLIDRGARMTCLDLSLNSLRRCQQVNSEAEIVHGSALALPFPDGSFEHAISIGVLHHTPDCRHGFKELARVTASGGTVVVFLYNYWNVYNPIYHAFKPIRAAVPLDRIPHLALSMLQPFVKSHLKQTLNDDQLRNLLGDKLWTPQATFHSVSEVRKWGLEEGLKLTATKKFFLGYANVMRFVKQGQPDSSVRRELALKCLRCGESPMLSQESLYTCSRCGNAYQVDGGIVRTTD